ncbi:MAG: MarR family winged helix-turn-helix transcriptional regulator [Albidovulum sp.]|uniref:MarR family winged helix-turn-helix transcriptional regulator n=1 Tax=Albidovulum sp. TaxID=1872424 RepID=UPI003C935675
MNQSNLPVNAEDMFCHAIYATWHVVNRSYKKHLARLDLTYPQYITLTLLWEKDDRTVGDIAACLAMETSTLTPLLKRLEGQGRVKRERNRDDERQVVISLTAAGKALQADAGAITGCMIAETGLDLSELERLVGVLGTLRAGLGGSIGGPKGITPGQTRR